MHPAVQEAIENSFGVSLDGVQIHADSHARRAAESFSARAFTYGNHIFLGKNETVGDVRLIAHEAAHVVQQKGLPSVHRWASGQGDAYEREADRASSAVMRGEKFSVSERVDTPRVQRWGLSDALDYFADKANIIPGFRMFTIVLGLNPINMAHVDRNAANILRAVVEFIPGGALITQALDKYGVFDKVGNWVDQQIQTLGLVGSSIKKALDSFTDSLHWSDILKPGDVWERAKHIFTDPIERIRNFVAGLVDGIIKFIKDAILMPLAKLAEGTRGWDLLIAILGKNPITDEPVPQSPEILIGGFMKLIGQEEVWNNLQKAGAVSRAWAWFQSALRELLAFLNQIPSLFIGALKSLEIADIIVLPNAFIKVGKAFGDFAGKFITWAGNKVLDLLQIIFEVLAPSVMPYLKKVGAAFKSILKNPIGFIGNLVKAAMLGFQNFAANFGAHLKAGLIDWLTGSLPGVYIPKAFELGEIVKFVFSVLGISWQNIRQKLVKVVGEPAVKAMETGFDIVVTLVTQGPAAAWDKIKEQLSNLKDMVIGGITDFVVDMVVKKAVPKIVAMFIPGAGFISAIVSIYGTIMVFVDKLKQIAQVVTAFVDSIVAIANGVIGAAANRVESTLAGLLSLAINFLAGFAGLGKVADKVMGVINKVRATIDKALDSLITWIVTMAKKLFAKVFGKNEKDGKPDERTEEQKQADVKAAVAEAEGLLNGDAATPESVRGKLPALKSKYKLARIELEALGPNEFDIVLEINPSDRTKRKKFDPKSIKVGDQVRVKALKKGEVNRIYNPENSEDERYRFIPAPVVTVDPVADAEGNFKFEYKIDYLSLTGWLNTKDHDDTWKRSQPGLAYKKDEEWEKIKNLDAWTSFNDARQVLNWRHHNNFKNPGDQQWEHVVEQSAGGPNAVDNLALTSSGLNQEFNSFFARKYTAGEISAMPGTGGKSLREFLKGQDYAEHRRWKERCYAIFRVKLVLMSNERGRFQIIQ